MHACMPDGQTKKKLPTAATTVRERALQTPVTPGGKKKLATTAKKTGNCKKLAKNWQKLATAKICETDYIN